MITTPPFSINGPLRLTPDDSQRAWEAWGFNCGPGALCAALSLTPEEIRPHLLDFEEKGYTNPSLMKGILEELSVPFTQTYRSDQPAGMPIVHYGLMRVQWGGPWCKPGVPMRARYRQSHWVAVKDNSALVFDVNADTWLKEAIWAIQLIPWLIKQCCPKGDGTWWPTHVLELGN